MAASRTKRDAQECGRESESGSPASKKAKPTKKDVMDAALQAFLGSADGSTLPSASSWFADHGAAYGVKRASFIAHATEIARSLAAKRNVDRRELVVDAEVLAASQELISRRRGPGRQPALSKGAEGRVFARVISAMKEFRVFTSEFVLWEMLREAGRPQSQEEVNDPAALSRGVAQRVARLGADAVWGFEKRFGLTEHKKRLLDEPRCRAAQPEKAVQGGRHLIWFQALVQIANTFGGAEKRVIPGWSCPPGKGPQRTDGDPLDFRAGDLEVRCLPSGEKVIWITALDEQLRPATRVCAADEVPMSLADVNLTSLDTKHLPAIAQRMPDAHVTATALVDRVRGLLCVQLIVPWNPIKEQTVSFVANMNKSKKKVKCAVSSTEKGYQTQESLENIIPWIADTINARPDDWAILLLDGHVSHFSRKAMAAFLQHHIFVVIEPSQTSTWFQSGDQGGHRCAHNEYRAVHTAAAGVAYSSGIAISNESRLEMVYNAFVAVKQSTWKEGFSKIGFPSGKVINFHEAFPPSTFDPGASYRVGLPAVTSALLKDLFSFENLVLPWSAPMRLVKRADEKPELTTRRDAAMRLAKLGIPDDQTAVFYVIKTMKTDAQGVRRLIFQGTLEESEEEEDTEEEESEDEGDIEETDVECGARGISTAWGFALRGRVADQALQRLESRSKAQKEKQELAEQNRKATLATQDLLRDVLQATGFISAADRNKPRAVTVKVLRDFVEANEESLKKVDPSFAVETKKDAIVTHLTEAIKANRQMPEPVVWVGKKQ